MEASSRPVTPDRRKVGLEVSSIEGVTLSDGEGRGERAQLHCRLIWTGCDGAATQVAGVQIRLICCGDTGRPAHATVNRKMRRATRERQPAARPSRRSSPRSVPAFAWLSVGSRHGRPPGCWDWIAASGSVRLSKVIDLVYLLPSHDCSSRRPVGGLLERGSVAILQPGKACWSRTAISFSTSGTGSGWSIPKRKAPDEVE